MSQRRLDELASSRWYVSFCLAPTRSIALACLLLLLPTQRCLVFSSAHRVPRLLLSDEAVRVAVALILGTPLQQPQRCRCGTTSYRFGHHNLYCHRNSGRLPRHGTFNVVYRCLATAGLTALLEPWESTVATVELSSTHSDVGGCCSGTQPAPIPSSAPTSSSAPSPSELSREPLRSEKDDTTLSCAVILSSSSLQLRLPVYLNRPSCSFSRP